MFDDVLLERKSSGRCAGLTWLASVGLHAVALSLAVVVPMGSSYTELQVKRWRMSLADGP